MNHHFRTGALRPLELRRAYLKGKQAYSGRALVTSGVPVLKVRLVPATQPTLEFRYNFAEAR